MPYMAINTLLVMLFFHTISAFPALIKLKTFTTQATGLSKALIGTVLTMRSLPQLQSVIILNGDASTKLWDRIMIRFINTPRLILRVCKGSLISLQVF